MVFIPKLLCYYHYCIMEYRSRSSEKKKKTKIVRDFMRVVRFLSMRLICSPCTALHYFFVIQPNSLHPLKTQKQLPEVFCRKGCFANFTEKQLCWSLFLIKTLLKKIPTQVFSFEICEIFKNTILKNIYERLLLKIYKISTKFFLSKVCHSLIATVVIGQSLTNIFRASVYRIWLRLEIWLWKFY